MSEMKYTLDGINRLDIAEEKLNCRTWKNKLKQEKNLDKNEHQ